MSLHKDYFFINVVRYDLEILRRRRVFYYEGGISVHYSYNCDFHKLLLTTTVYIGG